MVEFTEHQRSPDNTEDAFETLVNYRESKNDMELALV